MPSSTQRSRPPFRPADSRFGFTVTRPVAILMVVMAVGVFGWVSYNRLALTLMPDMSYPTLTVRTEYPGTAPEEIENVIARPLEQELGILPGLVSISSISKAGQCDILLEFQWDADMAATSQEVREKIDRIRMPDGAERPLLLRYDPSLDPVLRIGLAGPQSLYELRYLAENDIKRRLDSLTGVAAVRVKGGLEEQFLVAIDETRLATLGLDIGQVNQRLQQGNVNLPGGTLREGQTEYIIRTFNEFQTVEEIGALIIQRRADVDIRLRDIATIERFYKDREIITRVNGRESVELEIFKEADANVITMADTVKAMLFGQPDQQAYIAGLQAAGRTGPPAVPAANEGGPATTQERRRAEAELLMTHLRMTDFLANQLPEGVTMETLSDQSIFIGNSISEVKGNAVAGAIIAVFVLFLFLRNVGHTLIIGAVIPISVLATFAPMYMAGVSLNIISLGGLALGVGMLMDNSIVVLESIFRCREEGDDFITSVVRGTDEVGMAVVASTLTSVAVFFPIVFVEGVAGQVFGDMALTVVFSLLASLVAGLFLIPMLASRRFDPDENSASSRVRRGAYLQFPSRDEVGYGPAIVRTVGLIFVRIVIAVGIVLAAILKCIVSLVSPFFAVVGLRAPARWADSDHFGPLRGEQVWPGLLSFAAASSLLADAGRLGAWLVRPPRALAIARLIPAAIAFVFLLARLVVASLLRLLASVILSVVLMLAQFIIGIIRLLALLITPMGKPLLDLFEGLLGWLQGAYPRFLAGVLQRRALVLGGVFAAFVACCVLVLPRLGRELIPQVHQGEFNLDVTLPIGTPLEQTAEVASVIERTVMAEPEVERIALTVGAEAGASTSSDAGEHTARLTVRLQSGMGAEAEAALIERLRAGFRDLPEVEVEVTYPALFTVKSPIEVEIRGHDLELLKQASRDAETILADVPGLVDVRSSLQSGNPEIQVNYDRDRLAEYGLSLRSVAELVRNKIQGTVATEFRQEDRMIDILVRLREKDRFGIEELRRLIVNPGGAVPIPLSAVADLAVNEGPSEIRRINQQRAAIISANVQDADLGTVSQDIVATLQTMTLPSGFSFAVSGQNEEMKTSLNSLLLAFALALFLVYIVMASQFESLIQPLLIMVTVPLALIGVSLVLWLGGLTLNIMVFLGLIILAGIVVNNAIVLVDYTNTLCDRGMERTAAIIEAGRARLRPVLMTSFTTVLGLAPMALGVGEGAEIRAPMAITVIAGLATANLLTLLVMPALYYQFGGKHQAVAAASFTPPAEADLVPVGK